MRVLLLASEAVPYAKTGGLADVAGALYHELRAIGLDVMLAIPLYRFVLKHAKPAGTGLSASIQVGQTEVRAEYFKDDGVVFVGCDRYFDRDELYGTRAGQYDDNAERFSFFCRAALEACGLLGFRPDIIHANDWQTALAPIYARSAYAGIAGGAATVLTIHNLGYQGIFPPSALSVLHVPPEYHGVEGLEYYGNINMLKAGIRTADAVTTVSPTYAREIAGSEFGFGLDGVISSRGKAVKGILNGIDTAFWDPATDPMIPASYSSSDMRGKVLCKAALAAMHAFGDPARPMVGMVGRLAGQKGLDVFMQAAPEIFRMGLNVCLVGQGAPEIEEELQELATRHDGEFFLRIGFDEELAHRIFAGSDMFLIPSYYEPCGLTQMAAMRYGAVPVGRRTGGIRDTVIDNDAAKGAGTGFTYDLHSPDALLSALGRAIRLYRDQAGWKAMVSRCMAVDFSWKKSAEQYASLYETIYKG